MSEDLAGVIVMVTLILTTGGVLVFRPIAKRLGLLLEAMAQERLRRPPGTEMTQIRETLSRIDSRLGQIEERQDFAEALISASDAPLAVPPLRGSERN